jgi:DNA-directed RNA polymerase subunit RPC12/RpoP
MICSGCAGIIEKKNNELFCGVCGGKIILWPVTNKEQAMKYLEEENLLDEESIAWVNKYYG